jgi:hypothetical protein
MGFLKKVLLACCVMFFITGNVCASEVMLKIACIESGALDAFRVLQAQFFLDPPTIDYNALAAALTHLESGPTDSMQNASIQSSRLIPAFLRDVPVALRSQYPEQGRLIGRQMPSGSSGWHKYLIDFNGNAQVAFIELGVEHAVLDSLAIGSTAVALHARSIQQYTQDSTLNPDSVFTAGYSFFIQQLARGNANEWLQSMMPLKDGTGVLALRRSGAETRTDTLILRIDSRYFLEGFLGTKEVLIVLGWDRLQ